METRTITLTPKQAKALAHWVNTFSTADNFRLHDDLLKPENAEYLAIFEAVNSADQQLNRRFNHV